FKLILYGKESKTVQVKTSYNKGLAQWRVKAKLKFRLSIPQKANYIDFFLKFIQLIGFCLLCR
ncbi:hypothetical protein, partial [Paenimyroides tangerinum]|uniref:hypothetical protein n=1 Tax=Paenimyroides tangerinum TaxID=2488728 RepID=UPI0019396F05